MADLGGRFRGLYGAAVWHLPLLLAAFALTAWVALRLAGEPAAARMAIWFVGAVVAHDLVLFPIYASVDGGLRGATRDRPTPLNHIRVPALASGLLFTIGIVTLEGMTILEGLSFSNVTVSAAVTSLFLVIVPREAWAPALSSTLFGERLKMRVAGRTVGCVAIDALLLSLSSKIWLPASVSTTK